LHSTALGVIEALLAIDVGTARTRARLFSPVGKDLDEASRPTMIEAKAAGTVELDLELLWSDVCEIVARLANRSLAIRGVGVTAQLGTVLLDHSGQASSNAILWADSRAHAEAEELDHVAGADGRKISGRRVTAELLAPRLKWFNRHRPDLMRGVSRVISLKDFLVFRLTGALITDETHASYTGLFDVGRRAWSDELIALFGCDRSLLPPVHRASLPAGVIAAEASSRTQVAEDTPVAVGGPDGSVGTIGAGAVCAGVTVDVAGTTDVLLHATDTPIRDAEGAMILNAHAAPGLWTVGGPTGYTGGGVAWLTQILDLREKEAISAALSDALTAVPPGCDGLVFSPSLTGSRFPDWATAERGTLSGISAGHGRLHLLRAAQEGSAFMVAHALDTVRSCGAVIDRVVLVGGLASNPAAVQLRADVLGLPVVTLANKEASSIGAAMLAATCGGVFENLSAAADVFVISHPPVKPNPAAALALATARNRWTALRSALAGG
jgi:xylulokinase